MTSTWEAAAAEDDGLGLPADPRGGDAARLQQRAAAQAEVPIDERRVVEDEAAFALRGAGSIHERDLLLFEQPPRQLGRIRDRRRRADERRMGAVELADAAQPAQHVRDLTAEQAAIGVELVDHDVLQAREEAAPLRVVRQHAGVQHVRVRQHDVAAVPDQRAPPGGRVTVVDVDLDVDREATRQRAQLGQLVLGEGLGRKQVQGPARRLLEQALKDRQVVAQRLPARGRCHDDEVPAAPRQVVGLGLVRVEALDAASLQGLLERWSEIGRQRPGHGLPRRDAMVERDVAAQLAHVERRRRAVRQGEVAIGEVLHGVVGGR